MITIVDMGITANTDITISKARLTSSQKYHLKGGTFLFMFIPSGLCYNRCMGEDHSTEKAEPTKKPKRKITRRTMPAVLRVLLAILLMAFLSVIYTWFILWRQNLCDSGETDLFISENILIFVYSCLIIFCLMTVIAAITWRVFFTSGLMFAVISIITFIHMQKYELRSAPLLPEDFKMAGQAGELAQFVEAEAIVRLVCGVVFILVGSILLEYFVRKVCGRNRKSLPWWERHSLIPRVTLTLAAVTTLVLVAKPVYLHEDCSAWLGEDTEFVAWNQTDNYNKNGFVIGFLYNLGKLQMKEPESYNEETMLAIAEKYRAIKAADTGRVPLSEVADNVIFVMDESFYDPALLLEHYNYSGGDVLPNLHKLFLNYPSGYMYSPEYGGNTANVEFEGQTGLSNFWAQTFPYVDSLTRREKVLGIANWTKASGFETTAIHAFDGNIYKRNFVYPILGFDEFLDADRMHHSETEGEGYISDWSVYQEVLDVIKGSKSPQMVAAITMQNHMPYTAANYPTLDFKVAVAHDWLEANYQSLHYADQYLGEFIKELDKLDEKTVLIWFGDHAAALLNAYIESDDKDERDIAHFTPYFIYANFDIESPYTVAEAKALNAAQGFSFPTSGVDLPTTTPNCLLNTMYNILGVEKPALFYLLDTICEESPSLAVTYYSSGMEPKMTEALREYELVNYDVLSGQHYWYGD